MSRILLLNGTSSAGKTTLAHALRPHLPPTFSYFSSDQLADAGFRPLDLAVRFATRPLFFAGFHRAVAAFAAAGNDLLVEHIVEERQWADDLVRLLAPFDTFWVGVHAPLAIIESREVLRGDRAIGEAAFHDKTHTFMRYNVEVDTTEPLPTCIEKIVAAWNARAPR